MAPEPEVRVNDLVTGQETLQRAFSALEDAVDVCTANYNRIVGDSKVCFMLLGPVPQWFLWRGLRDLRDELKKVVDHARKVLREGLPIISLFKTSIDYLTLVQAPVSTIASGISTPQDDNFHYWADTAATAYKQKRDAQAVAASKAAEAAVAASKWLFDVGKTNVTYATELLKLLVDIGSELVKVSLNAATVINVPFAIDDLNEAVKKALKAGIGQLVDVANKAVTTLGNCRELLALRENQTPFPDGRWPQAVYSG
jgi:hypothetical protein